MQAFSPAQIRSYRENGYLVVPSGLEASDLKILKADTLALLAQEEERKASDPKYLAMTKYRRFTVGLAPAELGDPRLRPIGSLPGNRPGPSSETRSICIRPPPSPSLRGKNHPILWHQDAAYEADGHFPRLICWTAPHRVASGKRRDVRDTGLPSPWPASPREVPSV